MNASLIDTDILSQFFRGNSKVATKMKTYLQYYDSIPLSIITFYEILNGLYYKDSKNMLRRFLEFTSMNNVVPLTVLSTKLSARIYAELRKNGITIGHTDVLIAGIALTNGMTLITNNTKHFDKIDGLVIETWM